MQRWALNFERGGGVDTPTHSKPPGQPRKISSRTLQFLKRELDKNPRLTARQLKVENAALLGDVSTRTVSSYLIILVIVLISARL